MDVDSNHLIFFVDGRPEWSGVAGTSPASAREAARWRANRLRGLVEFCDRWVAAMEKHDAS